MTAKSRVKLRRVGGLVAATLLTILAASPVGAETPSPDGDDQVTGQSYVRQTAVPTGIAHCNNTATKPAGDNNPNDADVDSNDGGSRRQGNEPYSVIDPTDPTHIFAGWNDYCLTDLAAGWKGFAYASTAAKLDRLDSAGLSAGHLGGGHGVAAVRRPHRCRGPDCHIRQGRQPVRRRHRLQSGQAIQRRRVRRDYGTNRRGGLPG